jgi:hypothetical protein
VEAEVAAAAAEGEEDMRAGVGESCGIESVESPSPASASSSAAVGAVEVAVGRE